MAKVAEQPTSSSAAITTNELQLMDAYWRACNYLSAGMIYLRDNPLLRQPLKAEHIKNRLQNQIIDHTNYAHENGIDPPEITKWRWPF